MMTTNRNSGIYLHIPFCVSKCAYCAFNSVAVGSAGIPDAYVDAMLRELDLKISCAAAIGKDADSSEPLYNIDSIYLGGGTPSLLSQKQLTHLLSGIYKHSALSFTDEIEITLESNPCTFDAEKLRGFKRAGVNRLSIGAESLCDEELAMIGRAHTRAEFLEAFSLAREAGFSNINADLIFSLPGQSEESWRKSLRSLIELKPEHISFYSLQLEEGTKLFERFLSGELNLPSDEADRRMYHTAIDALKSAGYHHYEISNAAKPGYECRHNLKYWSMGEWLALGVSAHSYMGGTYIANIGDIERYMEVLDSKSSINLSAQPSEILQKIEAERTENDAHEMAKDFMITGLRKTAGVEFSDFYQKTGCEIEKVFSEALAKMHEYEIAGLVQFTANGMRLTEKGIDISSSILCEFV